MRFVNIKTEKGFAEINCSVKIMERTIVLIFPIEMKSKVLSLIQITDSMYQEIDNKCYISIKLEDLTYVGFINPFEESIRLM